ncbi:hypothetical protein AWR36_010685 [Microbulbifer flavimaris]|uniref:Oligosaccharide biosynthesis protein Alg14 like n=1 Tax=Microbulbifer flavimaris TaxID=1781068 RepID=A0ABX4HZF8_9GAMM|nr:hypothetical protein AWR36_010685 [Microbulbifer flavimaris]
MDKKVLAVASQGGHWQQLEALIPAFKACQPSFASTTRDRPDLSPTCRYYPLPNANRRTPLQAIWLLFTSACLIIRLRPDVIISTGALPGLACIFWGRFFGARTLWIDSIANADRLSLSGRIARYLASATLSQWPDLGRMTGVEYRGAVL